MKTHLLLIAESVDNEVTRAGYELTGFVEQLGSVMPVERAAFLLAGSKIRGPAKHLAEQTGLDVHMMEHPSFRYPNPERLADLAHRTAVRAGCGIVCFPHTSSGCHAAAKTAIELDAACVAGVDRVWAGPHGLVLRSALFNGKMTQETVPDRQRLVLTVLPGAFSLQPAKHASSASGKLLPGSFMDSDDDGAYQPMGIHRMVDPEADAAIDRADILVAVGRGIGSVDNLALVEQLVRRLPNAAMAASRPLCDLKWLPYSRQVGATGKTVAPKLYLACGISGAQQHVCGMKEALWVVAINNDPGAAIFSIADHCIVEDLLAFLPLLIEACQG